MSLIQVRLTESAFTPTEKTGIVTVPSWTWAEIEDVLSAEWEIGGSAIPTDAVRALIAGK